MQRLFIPLQDAAPMSSIYLARKLFKSFAAVSCLLIVVQVATAQPTRIVTQPGDTIELVNGTNDGDANSGPPPGGETVDHTIDGVGQKYLNFLDLGSGFAVTPSAGPSIVNRVRLYTANDEEPRDPASIVIEGSNGAISGPFTSIFQGDLALPAGRNPGGNVNSYQSATNQPIDLATNGMPLVFQDLSFTNTATYLHYRVTFPTLKDAAMANSMQIGEVQLIGTVIPEPTSVMLFTMSVIGFGVWRPRRRR
jgi:hypothetical protein